MKRYLAIDPGANGGWAYHSGEAVFTGGNDELLDATFPKDTIIVIENVPPFTGRIIPSSRSFKLGYSFGWVVGLFEGRGNKVILVTPQKWQGFLNIGTKSDLRTLKMTPSKLNTAWKNKLADEARKLFPTQNVTLKNSDAFCLLWYAQANYL